MVYTAGHLSLAALELLVHVDSDIPLPAYEAVEIEIPDTILPETIRSLPDGWYEMIPPADCKRVGDEWIESGRSLLLELPSAVVPEEFNYLLNPTHPEMEHVRISRRRPFSLDERLIPSSPTTGISHLEKAERRKPTGSRRR